MKKIKLLSTLLIGQLLSVQALLATDISDSLKLHFVDAKQELINMLDGKSNLSYEKAIFTIENAYWGNQVDAPSFNYQIDQHIKNIQSIIAANRNYSNQNFTRTLLETEEQKKAKYERALANWAIFSYMTDTTFFFGQKKLLYNLPFSYSTNDPLGTIDWSNTQVFNLLDTKQGNCFALVSLFKIFSERLNSQAIICTAPGHIYIRHADHKGIYHNVELATGTFPGTGSMQTLTYTTDEATKKGISLRELELKQSVALCLVYLAKGYEYKFNTRTDNFILECAELAFKYDSLNLNAMLLKAEVLEEKLIAKNKTIAQLQKDNDFIDYENFITHLFSLGYREMPMEMKNLVISRLRNEDAPYPVKDHTPKPNEHLGVKNDRYFTLSGGLFDEMMLTKPVEQYHRTYFDTKKKKISAFVPLDTTYNKYPIDLVVFAWSVDPLAQKYPDLSPYCAFANNPIMFIDQDGREPRWGQLGNLNQIKGEMAKVYTSNTVSQMSMSNLLGAMQQHFEANRTFKYDEKSGSFNETSSKANNVNRYMYTEKSGWIDMNHFFAIAQKTLDHGGALAEEYAYESENIQGKYKGSESSYSYEDLPSNFAGIDFISKFGSDLKKGNIGLMDAVDSYFKSLGATDPSKAPNAEFIPYFADDKAPKNYTPQGLIGDKLKNASKASFDKKSPQAKERIQKAQKQITN